MPPLRILVPIHTMPNITSVTVVFFENLLSLLKTMTDVHVIWLVYTPERLSPTAQKNPDITILDIHNYKNALEVIQLEKPDIIYANETWSFIDHAISSAAKLFNIPTFCMVYSDIWIKKNTTTNIISNANRFFQSSIPTDTKQNKKKFMRRGRFYIYKYIFLLRTMMAIKTNRLQTLFTIWKFVLLDRLHPRFDNDTIQFLENESLLKQRLDIGFKRSNLVVTGNPIYDTAFKKLTNTKPSIKKGGLIQVLLAPSTLYEHGFWTSKQRDIAIKETLTKILENRKEMSVIVKIHPSTSVLSEYQSIINSIDPSVPVYQKGDIQEFLEHADVIVSFQSSTTEVYALLAKKPIIICNFFNLQGDVFLERNLVTECKNPSDLVKSIHQALSSNPVSEQMRKDFIREFMYKWDGCAAERICGKIMSLLEKTKINQ